jgi:hypothetical protein
VLLINEKITPVVQKVINYWMKANDCDTQAYQTDSATICFQSPARNTADIENQPCSSVQLAKKRVRPMDDLL